MFRYIRTKNYLLLIENSNLLGALYIFFARSDNPNQRPLTDSFIHSFIKYIVSASSGPLSVLATGAQQ